MTGFGELFSQAQADISAKGASLLSAAESKGASLIDTGQNALGNAVGNIGTNVANNIGKLGGKLANDLSHKLLGGLGNGLFGGGTTYFDDSKHAAWNFGTKSTYYQDNTPRLSFQYFVRFIFNDNVRCANGTKFVQRYLNTSEQAMLIPLVKSVDMPSATVDTTILNQYNRKRIAQTKVHYEPIALTMHDVVDGKTLRLWEMYYEYYFKDNLVVTDPKTGGPSYDIKHLHATPPDTDDTLQIDFDSSYGYNMETVQNNKQLIKNIDIFQVHGGRFSAVTLINPRITSFKHDTLRYDKNDLTEMTFGIEYERSQYMNYNMAFTDSIFDELAKGVYQYGQFSELDGYAPNKPDFHERWRDPFEPAVNVTGLPGKPDLSVLGNLERNIGNIINDIPGQIGNAVGASILTGKFKNPINVQNIKRELVHNAIGETKGVATRVFASTAKAAVGDVIDVFRKKP
jgi:hypothetical protein